MGENFPQAPDTDKSVLHPDGNPRLRGTGALGAFTFGRRDCGGNFPPAGDSHDDGVSCASDDHTVLDPAKGGHPRSAEGARVMRERRGKACGIPKFPLCPFSRSRRDPFFVPNFRLSTSRSHLHSRRPSRDFPIEASRGTVRKCMDVHN